MHQNQRKQQFNIQAAKLSDEGYAFVEELARTRKLTAQFAQWAEDALRKKELDSELRAIREELAGLKRLIVHALSSGVIVNAPGPAVEDTKPVQTVPVLVSTDKVASTLDDDDVDYNY